MIQQKIPKTIKNEVTFNDKKKHCKNTYSKPDVQFFEKLRRTFSSESSLDKYKQIMFLKLSFLKKLQQPLKIDFLFVQVG